MPDSFRLLAGRATSQCEENGGGRRAAGIARGEALRKHTAILFVAAIAAVPVARQVAQPAKQSLDVKART